MKRVYLIVVILLIAIISMVIPTNIDSTPLVHEKAIHKQVGDFIVYIKVEGAKDGIKVLNSLQYVGEKPIEIKHQTPLVSICLGQKNHDYTGSLVTKRLQEGSIYYQEEETLQTELEGENNLYVKARFIADGELVSIDHVEKLVFH